MNWRIELQFISVNFDQLSQENDNNNYKKFRDEAVTKLARRISSRTVVIQKLRVRAKMDFAALQRYASSIIVRCIFKRKNDDGKIDGSFILKK